MARLHRLGAVWACLILVFILPACANDEDLFAAAADDFNNGRYAEASVGFSKLDRDDAPADIRVRAVYYLGRSFIGAQEYDKARDAFLKIQSYRSDNDLSVKSQENLILIAEQYAARSDWPEVSQTLAPVSLSPKIDPGLAARFHRLTGLASYQRKDFRRSADHLLSAQQLLRIPSLGGMDDFVLGVSLFQCGDREKAQPVLERATGSADVPAEQSDYAFYLLAGIALERGRAPAFDAYLSKIRNDAFKKALVSLRSGAGRGGPSAERDRDVKRSAGN